MEYEQEKSVLISMKNIDNDFNVYLPLIYDKDVVSDWSEKTTKIENNKMFKFMLQVTFYLAF